MARPPLAFHEQTDVHTRKLIADALFWPGAAKAHSGLKQYFEYYDSQIRQIRTYEVLGSADKAGAIRTHIDMLGVLEVLRQHRGAGRADMRDHLRWSRRGISQEGLVLDWAIAVTLRLCLMLDIFDHSSQRVHEHSIPQEWRDGSLENWLGSLVPKSKMTPSHVESRQDPSFTAAFMVDVCGLTIRWTKSLPEHLLFDPKRRELAIFPHKEYIRALTERKKTAPNSLP